MPLVISPLLGLPVLSWQFTAFRTNVAAVDPASSSRLSAVLFVLPVLVQAVFLWLVSAFGGRIRSAALRIGLHFAGFWTVLLLASPVAALAYLGRGQLARLLAPALGRPPVSLGMRIVATLAASLVLLLAARICAGRLISDARRALWDKAWAAVAVLVVPVLAIILAAFGLISAFRFLGPRMILYLLVPAAACVLLALLGLYRRPPPAAHDGLSSASAFVVLCIAVAFFAGAQNSAGLRQWLLERHLESARTAHYQILYDPRAYAAASIERLAAEHESTLGSLASRIQAPIDGVQLRIILYPDSSSKKTATGDMAPHSVEGTTIRAVLGGYVHEVDMDADAAALLDAVWGRPGSERLGGWVACWLAGKWRDQPLEDWARQIESEVGHYSLADLLDGRGGVLSPLVREPLGGAWVKAVVDRSGIAAARQLHAAKPAALNVEAVARLLGAAPAQLEDDWRHWTAENASRAATDAPARRQFDGDFFFRGISFSHEGYTGTGDGYASPQAAEQLRRLKALGANAIALVPYGFSRGTNDPAIFYAGTDESDEQLSAGLYAAHHLGMKVMLKPHLWLGQIGYSGAIRFDDSATRALWMRNYREFILHYARLAELEHFDLLSIGNELEGVSSRQDDWRRLIADVRRVYHGPIAYACNWGGEFESLGFWDALDYISMNNYYPLREPHDAKAAPPRAEDLLPGANRLAEKLEAISRRWHKPILFTEVGYPSVRGGSSEPWKEDIARGVSVEEQAAAYEATFRAFMGRPWFRGMFWWKWPSNGRGGGPQDPSYTPLGKPAAEVVRAWFTRLAGAER